MGQMYTDMVLALDVGQVLEPHVTTREVLYGLSMEQYPVHVQCKWLYGSVPRTPDVTGGTEPLEFTGPRT